MPTHDRLQILLPKAIDLGYEKIGVRLFPIRIFAQTQNYYHLVRLNEISYSPAWARTEFIGYQSSLEVMRVAGEGGKIDIQQDITMHEPFDCALTNNSIDTEVMFTLSFIGWQYGEG